MSYSLKTDIGDTSRTRWSFIL